MYRLPFRRIRKNEKGQGMTEYLIIVALIAVAAIAVFAFFGQAIREQVGGLTNEVAGQGASGSIQAAQTSGTNAVANAKQGLSLKNYNDGGNSKVNAG
jgi:Flp pilus assembly pilin Flp